MSDFSSEPTLLHPRSFHKFKSALLCAKELWYFCATSAHFNSDSSDLKIWLFRLSSSMGCWWFPAIPLSFCLRENDQVQNSQLRIFYLQGSIYVPKIKVKQLFCGLGNLNRLLNEGSSPHPTTLESAFTSERKSRSNFQAHSKACLVPVSCDTSTLHPSKCKRYVGSHRCLGRWQAPPVSLAPSSKVQNHKWWNRTNHCLQGYFSSIFLTLRVPEITELEIS